MELHLFIEDAVNDTGHFIVLDCPEVRTRPSKVAARVKQVIDDNAEGQVGIRTYSGEVINYIGMLIDGGLIENTEVFIHMPEGVSKPNPFFDPEGYLMDWEYGYLGMTPAGLT